MTAATESSDSQVETLAAAAIDVMSRAYAPYSKFRVGAALLCADGTIFTGCNVENASYGLTLCAERNALVKAVSEGHLEFLKIVIVCSAGEPVAPCGACRQCLWEFAPQLEVIMVGTSRRDQAPLKKLLPGAFGPDQLS